jgi:hypothetical protein
VPTNGRCQRKDELAKTNSGNLGAYLSCAGLPAGATASFSSSSVVFSGGASTATATLTVATTTAVGNGTYTFSVTATDGGSLNTITNTGTLTAGNTAAVGFIPSITSLAPLPDGTMQVQAGGGVGQTYVVEGSSSLVPAIWVNLSTNLADASGTFAFTDLDAKNYSSRFYRLMTQP